MKAEATKGSPPFYSQTMIPPTYDYTAYLVEAEDVKASRTSRNTLTRRKGGI